MYPQEYYENDVCPHNTFSGCGCYDTNSNSMKEEAQKETQRYEEEYFREQQYTPPYNKRVSSDPNLWIDGKGSRFKLSDMTDLHLSRALVKCIEYEGIAYPRSKAIISELLRRALL